jgi:NodT family efflux transporter outer membrane factor (OMF) lipoprotein
MEKLKRAAIAALLLLSGCTVGPDFTPPDWLSPVSWFSDRPKEAAARSEPVSEPVNPKWWNLFHDKELTSLEEQVAAANLDVRVATIRLAESRAQKAVTESAAYPVVNGNASYTREEVSQRGVLGLLGSGSGAGGTGGATGNPATAAAGGAGLGTSANGNTGTAGAVPSSVSPTRVPPFNLWQYGFDASWEIDLWGRVRRSIESADATLVASAETRRATLLSSLAEMASDYMQLRGYQAQLKIARDNLRTAQQSLGLTQERATGGLTTDLDVANAAAQVRTTAAQIPQLQAQEAQEINAISLLLGQQPNALRAELETPRPIPPVPPRVPIGLPGELARRRPDIRQAEAQLHSATADVGVAVANFYPTVTLGGSAGIQALKFKDLTNWGARQYAFGPSITLPIFQGGQLKATLELRKAQQQEAAVNYQHTVLNAWHEVDNALTAYQTEQARRDQLALAVAQNRRALGLAQDRYSQGITDFLQVLTAQQNLLATEQQLAQSTTNVSNDLVALYRALGGGWETDFPTSHTVQPTG